MTREPVLRNTCHGPRTSLPQRACHSTDHVQQNISPNRPTRHSLRRDRVGRGTTTSRTTTRASNELSVRPPKSGCSGDAVLRTSTRGTVHMGQCVPEDNISQCPFLQMIDTAGNPHADGSAAPGARPRYRPSRHRDPPDTSRSHDNWMEVRHPVSSHPGGSAACAAPCPRASERSPVKFG